MSEKFTVKAFVCDLDADAGDGKLSYRPAKSDDEILEAPSASLIFPDDPNMSTEDVETLFDTKFPARIAGLSRTKIRTEYHYSSGPSIVAVEVLPEHEARLTHASLETAVRLATKHGYIRIDSESRYMDHELERYDCYVRWSEARQQSEIVYKPKVIARRKKRRQERANWRGSGYLTVYEVIGISQDAFDQLNKDLDLSSWWFYHWSRAAAAQNAVRWITLFNMVYGGAAHRQLSSFQKVIELWRNDKIRRSTISTWDASPGCGIDCNRLWSFFDGEKSYPKPRKRKLKVRNNLALTPLAPTTTTGVTATEYREVQVYIGQTVRVWLTGEDRPQCGRLKDVTPQGLVVTEKEVLVEWPKISAVKVYPTGNRYRPVCFSRKQG